MVLVLVSAGCTGVPSDGDSWPFGSSDSTPVATPEPTYVTPATPYPTQTSVTNKPTFSMPVDTPPTPDPYVTLYNKTSQFNYTTDAFTFNLTTPPLLIDFWVDPKMVTREKYATDQYGDRDWSKFEQTYPSPQAWFEVRVRERTTGEIVAQDGFGKLYSTDTHKQVVVRRIGDYLIELTGNEVKVEVLMRAGGI
jgi:hypothetical protein